MTGSRDIIGALNGSRFIEQPHIKPEVDATLAFIEGSAPVVVEVGFDHGRRLHSMARLNPDWRVVGLEVRKLRVAEAVSRAERDGLENIHPWRMDARTVFSGVLPPASVDVVEVLFPTPWWHPGLRQKRLLVDALFLEDVARVLRPGGVLHVATDVEDYAQHINAVLEASALVVVDATACVTRFPRCTQLSRREWKCERDGTQVWRWFAAHT